jgi:hypothetical protein
MLRLPTYVTVTLKVTATIHHSARPVVPYGDKICDRAHCLSPFRTDKRTLSRCIL